MHTPIIKQEALEYAEKEWPVLPIVPNAKNPLTTHGFKDATTDPNRITNWFTKYPTANVGIATGIESGLVVFDLDVKNGKDGVTALLDAVGALPKTLTATTPSGGMHHYYKHPGGHVPNRTDLLPGVDVRGDGGYVVAPPSCIDEMPYEFINDLEPAPLPLQLLTLLEKKKPCIAVDGTKTASAVSIKGVAQGSRDWESFRYSAQLRAKGLSKEEAIPLVLKKAEDCSPPFSPNEALKKLESAWKYTFDFPHTDLGNARCLRAPVKIN